MRAHYCWHSGSFPPPAHKYTQACDKHAHQMHKNKKVWVWSTTKSRYGHWDKENKINAYICRVSARASDQQAFKNIQQSLKYIRVLLFWNRWSYSELWFSQLILVLHKYPHSTNYVFSSLFLVFSWAVSYQRSAASRSMIHYCLYYAWTDFKNKIDN